MYYAILALVVTRTIALESGCGAGAPFSNGNGGELKFQHNGYERRYYMHIPTNYDNSQPSKLVMLFHGWGYSGLEWGEGKGWGAISAVPAANAHNYILIAPTGLTDSRWGSDSSCDNGNGYCSWNGFGSTKSPGADGQTCNPNNQRNDYCYRDTCGSCDDICWWTHCQDDVDFVVTLLDLVSEKVCVDPSNVFAGGESNGGMFTWELGMDSRSASRFAALSPTIGLPHRGFIRVPAVQPMPILVSTGNNDRTVPPGNNNDPWTEASDGFYYVTARTATKEWANAHGCNTNVSPTPYNTDYDGQRGLTCTSYSSNCDQVIVDCRQNGGHVVQSYIPDLMLGFFNLHPRCFSGSLEGCLTKCPVSSGCNCESLCSTSFLTKNTKKSDDAAKNTDDAPKNIGGIIGGVIGGIAGFIVILLLVYLLKVKISAVGEKQTLITPRPKPIYV